MLKKQIITSKSTIDIIEWEPANLPERLRAIDRALLDFHGDGAETLLWVGTDGRHGLENELLRRRKTFGILGSLILNNEAPHSLSAYAYGPEGDPFVLGFDAALFVGTGNYRNEYELIDPSRFLLDSLHIAYALPPMAD